MRERFVFKGQLGDVGIEDVLVCYRGGDAWNFRVLLIALGFVSECIRGCDLQIACTKRSSSNRHLLSWSCDLLNFCAWKIVQRRQLASVFICEVHAAHFLVAPHRSEEGLRLSCCFWSCRAWYSTHMLMAVRISSFDFDLRILLFIRRFSQITITLDFDVVLNYSSRRSCILCLLIYFESLF